MVSDKPSVDSIFLAAIELPPNQRAAYLDGACSEDAVLRARVERLLTTQSQGASFLESPAPELAAIPDCPVEEHPGSQIGPYKLLEQIGEGGFGVVFLAEQERPVRRRVALKVIKPGMDTREVIGRFEAERQVLAVMDHPNIAKVLDAGTTGEPGGVSPGRPYFVMELIQGVPITDYCDQCQLATKERLELFVAVCQAVQHAHQKGIIHRDLKPTNVLVAMQDGEPTPKIIDFGVAKAIGEQSLTDRTLTTAFAQMIGTPMYMSPEQAELSPLGVDTRSDIYSLGVMLYELLTGATPFDKDRLHEASYEELRQIIREEEPPRPSARISSLSRSGLPSRTRQTATHEPPGVRETAYLATTIAEKRRTDPRRLIQTVRGDLDWIVMKCLEKDRNRRYDSAGGLARDVERYLNDQPVQACPPSTNYRFRKFARRNKVLLGAGGAIAAALLIGLGLATWMYVRATTEGARAKAVADLLQEMLGSADAGRAKGADYKVRELLADFSEGSGRQPTDQPEVEADIHETMGRSYRSLRLPNEALPHFEKAIELRRQMDGPTSERLAAILVDSAWNLHDQERYSEAESQLNEALDIYRRRGVKGAPFFHALQVLQHVLISSDRDADAECVTQEALAVARHSGEEYPDQASLLHRYADLKNKQERYAEGEKLARQAVAMHRRLQGNQHPETAWALRSLAKSLQPQQEKLAEAEAALRESLAIFRREFPADHSDVREVTSELRTVLEARGDAAALEKLAMEEVETAMRADSPDNHARLASILLTHNAPSDSQQEEAHRQIRLALEGYAQIAIDSSHDLDRRVRALEGYTRVTGTCAARREFASEVDELDRRLGAELPKLLAAFPDSSDCKWETATIYARWALALEPYNPYLPTAETAWSKSIEILETLTLSDPKLPNVWMCLADRYIHLGENQSWSARPQDAEAAYHRAIEISRQRAVEIAASPASNAASIIASDYLRLAYFLVTIHREDEAAEFVRKAELAAKRLRDPAQVSDALFGIALARLRFGDEAGYREACNALPPLPGDNVEDQIRLRRIWIWCLGPHPDENLSLPLRQAEEFAKKNSLGAPYSDLLVLGGVYYRAGYYDSAAKCFKDSIAAYPGDPPFGFGNVVFPRLFLAMTLWQQGQRDDARRLLADTQPEVAKWLESPANPWYGREQLETYFREAQAMIEPKQSDNSMRKEPLPSTTPEAVDN